MTVDPKTSDKNATADRRFRKRSPALFASHSAIGLVADIGGTNTRFGLAGLDEVGAIEIGHRHDLRNDEHSGLEPCVRAYLELLASEQRPTMAAFGVASHVTADEVRLTNRDWSFSREDFRTLFAWSRFEVVNDFVAIGHSLADLKDEHWRPLAGPAWPEHIPDHVALVGPGTGFGVGSAIRGKAETVVTPTEGGHASFAPQDVLEIEILKSMLGRFPRVSNERILSGPGMENLYQALSEIRGVQSKPPPASAIVEAAARDPIAAETIERFCLILGGAMGDIALVQGAEAVAIGGGVTPRIINRLDTPEVRERFEAKGRGRPVLEAVPVALITHPEPGLLGAARLLFPI